jgi:hypothetical protein
MKNEEKEGFDVSPPSFGVSAYREEIERWRDDLRDCATEALGFEGIEAGERENLERAIKLLRSIDQLVNLIGKRPYVHEQAHELSLLWGIIGATFIIANRGCENPVTEKFLRDEAAQGTAHARSALPRTRDHDQIDKVIVGHCADLWKKKPMRAESALGTAGDIREGVNAKLAELGIDPLTLEALRKRIVLP